MFLAPLGAFGNECICLVESSVTVKYRTVRQVQCRYGCMDLTRTLGLLPQPTMGLNRVKPTPTGRLYHHATFTADPSWRIFLWPPSSSTSKYGIHFAIMCTFLACGSLPCFLYIVQTSVKQKLRHLCHISCKGRLLCVICPLSSIL